MNFVVSAATLITILITARHLKEEPSIQLWQLDGHDHRQLRPDMDCTTFTRQHEFPLSWARPARAWCGAQDPKCACFNDKLRGWQCYISCRVGTLMLALVGWMGLYSRRSEGLGASNKFLQEAFMKPNSWKCIAWPGFGCPSEVFD